MRLSNRIVGLAAVGAFALGLAMTDLAFAASATTSGTQIEYAGTESTLQNTYAAEWPALAGAIATAAAATQ